MGVLIGDLMAVAEERGGGARKNSGKRSGTFGKFARERGGDRDPSDRKERGPLDDNNLEKREVRDAAAARPSLRTQGSLPRKRMGELWELDFLRKAMGMGMIVSKPWGDSYRYDFVCDTGGRLWR